MSSLSVGDLAINIILCARTGFPSTNTVISLKTCEDSTLERSAAREGNFSTES